ncbi:uncharacterized protein LOC143364367 isoform X1 [Halictus rubicundus]|uniref:uncharacterized protein LOC143364367 isoform X1 n=1 Tax=Halictus rubicundus TaxID=77578 RepID=UPI004035F99F
MADMWNMSNIELLKDSNYFLWSEKIEGVLRCKKLWKRVIGVKPLIKPVAGEEKYDEKLNAWNNWDDDNYAARAIMINTMSEAQVLKYSREKSADKLWTLIKENMAAGTEELKAKMLNEMTNLKMNREEDIDTYINRAEALRNQCLQLGKDIEDYEIKMYILRGLRPEFDNNVRILETQRALTVNDIRFSLKQEELRKEKRNDDKTHREYEKVRNVRDIKKNEFRCHNCGIKGHAAHECYKEKRCYNCQGYGHIAADCRIKKYHNYSQGRGIHKPNQRGTRGRVAGWYQNKKEASSRTTDESVMMAVESSVWEMRRKTSFEDEENEEAVFAVNEDEASIKNCDEARMWLLDSGSTSHMSCEKGIFNKLDKDERLVTLADKKDTCLCNYCTTKVMQQKN